MKNKIKKKKKKKLKLKKEFLLKCYLFIISTLFAICIISTIEWVSKTTIYLNNLAFVYLIIYLLLMYIYLKLN